MRCLTLILSFMAAIAGSAFDVESAIVRMESSGRVTAIGKNTDCGSYVICRAEAEVGNDVNIAREQAKLKARTMIAELFSVKVSGSSSRTTITKESAGNDVESFDRSELSKSILRKDIGQVQRGLSVWREKIVGGKLIVYCLLTEQTMDATADLEKTMRKLGPDAVRVKGIGYFNEFVTEAKARVNAIEDAKRNAIADVLGMAMTAFSANQSVSTESVDNNGEETFACDDMFRCKTFSACAGFVESSRIVDEKKTDNAICVTMVAKVARGKLMDDYRAYLENMGNPGFCVRSNDPAVLSACSGFFTGLGLRMVGNIYSATYVIDAVGNDDGDSVTVAVTARDKIVGTVMFSVSNTVKSKGDSSSAYLEAMQGMKDEVHADIDRFIGRANADGRRVLVRLCNYDGEYKTVADVVKLCLEAVPGVKNVRKSKAAADTVEFTFNYVGDTQDLAEIIEKRIKTNVNRRRYRPKIGRVENTLMEFDFE